MSGITDPSEEYFKDGLWAWVTDQWKKLVADASNFLQINIAAQGIDVEIKQTTAADLTPGVMGWDGSAWRKLPMLWGYSDHWAQSIQDTASGAGHADAETTAVPAGYVYVVQAANVFHDAGVAKSAQLYASDGTVDCTLGKDTTLAAGALMLWVGVVALCAGDKIHGFLAAPGDGTKVTLRVWGYKMKVAE